MTTPPLAGITVLDLTRVLSGPYCTMLLGDLGAEVWKVEPPQGDDSRLSAPPFLGDEPAYYAAINRNKRGICLDLRRPEGREAVLRMAERADVVVENFRPDVKDRLGVGYAAVRARNPAIVYCSISGFGQTGPYRTMPGLDIVFQGMAGLQAMTGPAEGEAVKTGDRLADVIAGLNAAFGIMVALFHRARTGEGQYLDLALVETLLAAQAANVSYFFATGQQPPRTGNSSIFTAPTSTFATKDRPLNVCILNEKQWAAFCRALGRDDLAADPRFRENRDRIAHVAELDAIVAGEFARRTSDELLAALRAAEVPCGPIYGYAEVFDDPQIVHDGMRASIPHPALGTVPAIGIPIRFAKTPGTLRRPAPRLGEHGAEILAEAGFADHEIGALAASGALLAPAAAVEEG